MNTFVICLGSNVDDRDAILARAIIAIGDISTDTSSTRPYACPSYNGLGSTYHNVVMTGKTSRHIDELTALTKQIEVEFGRLPDSKATGIMPLDIDLIIWNDTIVSPEDYNREHFKIGYKCLLNN